MFAVASVKRSSCVNALKQTGKCLSTQLLCFSIDLAMGLILCCSQGLDWLHVFENLRRASADIVVIMDEWVKWEGIQHRLNWLNFCYSLISYMMS